MSTSCFCNYYKNIVEKAEKYITGELGI